MYKTINFSDFCDAFNGSQYDNNFTYEGKRALFDYIESYEDDGQNPIEFDMIALCCDYSEYDSAVDCIHDCGYNFEFSEGIDDDEKEKEAREYLENNTQVIDIPDWTEYTPEAQIRHRGGIIIQSF